MKVIVINDLHIGFRNGSSVFEEELDRVLFGQLIPYMDANNLKTIINAGDTFDDRGSIDVRALTLARRFADAIHMRDYNMLMLPGNHDIKYRDSLYPNSIEPIFGNYPRIGIIMEPQIVPISGVLFLFVPWICPENESACRAEIEARKARFAVTHTTFRSMLTGPGSIAAHGFDLTTFGSYELVLNGHIHHRSKLGNIVNLGTQYQQTWADHDIVKGFHVLDTDNGELEFIPNPRQIFRKINYDDNFIAGQNPLEWLQQNETGLSRCFVKLVVTGKQDRFEFDQFVRQLEMVGAYDLKFMDYSIQAFDSQSVEMDAEQNSKPTIELIGDFIESVQMNNLHKPTLKKLLEKVYVEAINRDTDRE
jgi:DNA repair exonuclease SbcCD nuclease subunit